MNSKLYLYSNIIDKKNILILNEINKAADDLVNLIIRIDLNSLNVSNYTKKYFKGYIENIRSVMQVYTYLVYLAMCDDMLNGYKEKTLVDYGGGTGILSLLARKLGLKKIIYVDIYDVSCRDARTIGKLLNLESDEYICGNEDVFSEYVTREGLSIDYLITYDVIEHVYDIENFFHQLGNLKVKAICASTANMYNPLIRKKRMDSHIKMEREDRNYEWGHKERDSLQSYYEIRKKIIKEYAPNMVSKEIEELAEKTRGLQKNNIEECVLRYLNGKDIMYEPDHPTNTCDPYNGNWNERLMTFSTLKKILFSNGFQYSFKCGYYGYSDKTMVYAIKQILNKFIEIMNNIGFVISPYYVIVANVKKSE